MLTRVKGNIRGRPQNPRTPEKPLANPSKMLAMIAPRERGVAGAGAEAKGSQVDLQPTVRR